MSEQYGKMAGDERLSEEDAHEEANMLRASMEKSDEKATPEDYDQAMEALDELKALAAEGPSGADKVRQRLTQLAVAGAFPFVLLGGVVDELIGGKSHGVKEDIDSLTEYFTKGGVAWTDAEKRLEALKHEAERMGN